MEQLSNGHWPGMDLGEGQAGFSCLCVFLRLRWDSQRNSRTVSDINASALGRFPSSLSASLQEGGP